MVWIQYNFLNVVLISCISPVLIVDPIKTNPSTFSLFHCHNRSIKSPNENILNHPICSTYLVCSIFSQVFKIIHNLTDTSICFKKKIKAFFTNSGFYSLIRRNIYNTPTYSENSFYIDTYIH